MEKSGDQQANHTYSSENDSIKEKPTSRSSSCNSTAADDAALQYGCCSSHPRCLQPLNNIVGFVTFISLANCMQCLANGLIGVVLSTIERHFDLSSSASSWIASSIEIGQIPVLVATSLLGTRVHRPRATAIGILTIGIGCVIFFIPQFTSPPYRPSDVLRVNSLCTANKTSACDVEADDGSLSYYLPVFIISRILLGMGIAPIISIGVNYIDDCTTKEKFATYAGIFNAMSVIGPALGFVFGAMTLSIFTDFYIFSSDEIGIDSSDPRWVGAWWLAYTFTAALCLLNAVPLMGYPRDLPGAAAIRAAKVTEAHKDQIVGSDGGDPSHSQLTYAKSVADYKALAKGVFTNPTFWMLTVFSACLNFLIAGFNAFGPKYFEFGFSMSPSLAGIMFGVVLLPAGAGGTIIGGLLIEKLRLGVRRIFHIQVAMSVLITGGSVLFLLICDTILFAGVTVPYNVSSADSGTMNLTNVCNVDCSCSEVLYEPICSHDGLQYFSPCHAGCQTQYEAASQTEFYNCSCISSPTDVTVAPAIAGVCSTGICTEAIMFLVGFFIAVVAIFIGVTTNMAATLRCVTSSQSVFAFGLQILLVKFLGTIPGPLLMGVVFDSTCMLWQNDCGIDGSCMFYDNNDLSLKFLFLCVGASGMSMVSIIIAVASYRPPTIVDQVVVKVDGDVAEIKTTESTDNESNEELSTSTAKYHSETISSNGFVNPAFDQHANNFDTSYF